ncbi:hypothetical protein [Agrococcus sp. SCSIO52902]|uniref:hypothetical protein n=1 Tax=Agrococcus sp. SCSIO52902 TaxID=2933290 RepID=UPI001FF18530|nr:hypothetical protein [Agrococcus sp. SCSIO52902]UOW00829.1 hypothetical protein MU522_13130 [Agrococcus sp. SCSIO52902]UOW00892.1 hypothetical protein MU522_00215 [Agrococcus sp. SCSIO52902]
MEPFVSNLQVTKSRLGVAARSGDPDRIRTARRDHAAAKIEIAIERVLAEAPPLTPEQRARIAALLRPAGGGSA